MLEKWNVFLEILKVFQIPYEATNALQSASFTLSDFYQSWLKAMYKLQRQVNPQSQTDFAALLLQRLKFRQPDLLNNVAMKCAVYLDPRVRFNLTEIETSIAKMHLEKIYSRIQQLKSAKNDVNESASQENPEDENQDDDSFQKHMAATAAEKENAASINNAEEVIASFNFMEQLDVYEKSSPFHQMDVLAYWESKKTEWPELYELSTIINSIPPTQTTVERTFSLLSFFFTVRRYNLGAKMLQDFLTIKLNEGLAREVNENELEELMDSIDSI